MFLRLFPKNILYEKLTAIAELAEKGDFQWSGVVRIEN